MVLPFIARISSGLDRAHWVNEVARFLSVPEEAVWQDVRQLKLGKAETADAPNDAASARRARSRRDLLEERLIGLAAWRSAENAADFAAVDSALFSPARRPFYEQALRTEDIASQDHYLKKLALEAELSYSETDKIGEEIQDSRRELRREIIKERLIEMAGLMRQSEQTGADADLQKNLEEFKTLTAELNQLR